MEEVWKPIPEYEDAYEISNLGRVRSLDRPRWTGFNYCILKGQIIKPKVKNNGYLMVHLWRDRKCKGFLVHRLVAQAFIPNPLGLSDVNHIDEDKTNNRINNLQWMSHNDNCKYGNRNLKRLETLQKLRT